MNKKDKLAQNIYKLESDIAVLYTEMKEIVLDELHVDFGIIKGFTFNGLSGSSRSKCKLKFLGLSKGTNAYDWKILVVKVKRNGSQFYGGKGGAHSFYITMNELKEWLKDLN